MIWLVNFVAVGMLIFIIWWFWLSRPGIVHTTSGIIEVKVVDGVYSPANIEIDRDRPVILRFYRLDATPCAETVLFDELGIRLELPLNKPRDLQLCIETPGKYRFNCDMNMYQGNLIVK